MNIARRTPASRLRSCVVVLCLLNAFTTVFAAGVTVPSAPKIGAVTRGDEQASVSLPFATVAQAVGHNNQLDITLVDGRHLQCDFSLNLLPLLHRHLAPNSHPGEFLQSFSNLSDAAMDKELDKLTQALSAQSFFTLPTGAKLRLMQWQLPNKQLIRVAMKVSLILIQMPPNAASHIDPMRVQAKASSKVPVSRIQLQLHPALFPIFVANKEDKFWLTPEIPTAIVDIH